MIKIVIENIHEALKFAFFVMLQKINVHFSFYYKTICLNRKTVKKKT